MSQKGSPNQQRLTKKKCNIVCFLTEANCECTKPSLESIPTPEEKPAIPGYEFQVDPTTPPAPSVSVPVEDKPKHHFQDPEATPTVPSPSPSASTFTGMDTSTSTLYPSVVVKSPSKEEKIPELGTSVSNSGLKGTVTIKSSRFASMITDPEDLLDSGDDEHEDQDVPVMDSWSTEGKEGVNWFTEIFRDMQSDIKKSTNTKMS